MSVNLKADPVSSLNIGDLSGGLNTQVAPTLLNSNEATESLNVSHAQKGTLTVGRGRRSRYAAPFAPSGVAGMGGFHKSDGTQRFVVVSDGKVYADKPRRADQWDTQADFEQDGTERNTAVDTASKTGFLKALSVIATAKLALAAGITKKWSEEGTLTRLTEVVADGRYTNILTVNQSKGVLSSFTAVGSTITQDAAELWNGNPSLKVVVTDINQGVRMNYTGLNVNTVYLFSFYIKGTSLTGPPEIQVGGYNRRIATDPAVTNTGYIRCAVAFQPHSAGGDITITSPGYPYTFWVNGLQLEVVNLQLADWQSAGDPSTKNLLTAAAASDFPYFNPGDGWLSHSFTPITGVMPTFPYGHITQEIFSGTTSHPNNALNFNAVAGRYYAVSLWVRLVSATYSLALYLSQGYSNHPIPAAPTQGAWVRMFSVERNTSTGVQSVRFGTSSYGSSTTVAVTALMVEDITDQIPAPKAWVVGGASGGGVTSSVVSKVPATLARASAAQHPLVPVAAGHNQGRFANGLPGVRGTVNYFAGGLASSELNSPDFGNSSNLTVAYRTMEQALNGKFSTKCTTTQASGYLHQNEYRRCNPGTYSASIWVFCPTQGENFYLRAEILDTGLALLAGVSGTTLVVDAGTVGKWVQLKVENIVGPVNSYYCRIRVFFSSSVIGHTFYVDAAQWEPGATITPFTPIARTPQRGLLFEESAAWQGGNQYASDLSAYSAVSGMQMGNMDYMGQSGDITYPTSGTGTYLDKFAFTGDGTPWVFSVMARIGFINTVANSTVTLIVQTTGGVVLASQAFTPTNDWQVFSLGFTPVNGTNYVARLVHGAANFAVAYLWCNLEKGRKGVYYTTPASRFEARVAERLALPDVGLSNTQGSVEFLVWWDARTRARRSSAAYLFEAAAAGAYAGRDRISAYVSNFNDFVYVTVVPTDDMWLSQVLIPFNKFTDNAMNRVRITWSTTQLTAYVNDVMANTSPNPFLPEHPLQNVVFGGDTAGNNAYSFNGWIADIRLSSTVRAAGGNPTDALPWDANTLLLAPLTSDLNCLVAGEWSATVLDASDHMAPTSDTSTLIATAGATLQRRYAHEYLTDWSLWETAVSGSLLPSDYLKGQYRVLLSGGASATSFTATLTVKPRAEWVSQVIDIEQVADKNSGILVAGAAVPVGATLALYSRGYAVGVWSAWEGILGDGTIQSEGTRVQLKAVFAGDIEIDKFTLSYDGTPAAELLIGGQTTGTVYTMTTFRDAFYLSNGVDPVLKWDGVNPPTVLVEAPRATVLIGHQNRLWSLGDRDNPSRVKFSDVLLDNSWPALNFIDLNPEDGDRITAGIRFGGNLVVSKHRSMALVVGDKPANFSVEWLEGAWGAQGPHALATTEKYVVFVAQDGLRFTDLTTSVLAIDRLMPNWAQLNHRRINQAALFYWQNTLFMAVPSTNSLWNDQLWVLDTLRNAWTIYPNWPVGCFSVFEQYGSPVLFCGDSAQGQVYEFTDDGHLDTLPVVYTWKSKDFDFGQPGRLKLFKSFFADVVGTAEDTTLLIEFFVDSSLVPTGSVEIPIAAGEGQHHALRLILPVYNIINGQRFAVRFTGRTPIYGFTMDFTIKGAVPGEVIA